MAKFHHKLFILNQFLKKNLTLTTQYPVRRTIDNISSLLHNQQKADKMKRLIKSVYGFYRNDQTEYPLKVAIFVGSHKVLNSNDYLKLRQSMLN